MLRASCEVFGECNKCLAEKNVLSRDREIASLRFLLVIELDISYIIQKPVKKSRWHQELSAVEYGAPCLQFMEFHKQDKYAGENMKRESEDCLYLNVFSPYVS